MIIARISHKETFNDQLDGAAVKSTFKVCKTATTKQIAEELAYTLGIGETCDHQHDCCGCWSNRFLKVRRTKPGEVYVTYHRYANV